MIIQSIIVYSLFGNPFSNCFRKQTMWLDAFSDTQATLYSFPGSVTTADLVGDGDYRLIIGDIGTGQIPSKLKVFSDDLSSLILIIFVLCIPSSRCTKELDWPLKSTYKMHQRQLLLCISTTNFPGSQVMSHHRHWKWKSTINLWHFSHQLLQLQRQNIFTYTKTCVLSSERFCHLSPLIKWNGTFGLRWELISRNL